MSKKSELEILNSYCDKWGKGNFIMHFGVWLNEEWEMMEFTTNIMMVLKSNLKGILKVFSRTLREWR